MRIEVNNKVTNFDLDKIAGMDFETFDKSCRQLPTFKDMLPKERTKKIKEIYKDASKRKTKADKKDRHSGYISGDNKQGGGNTSKPEQESAPGGEDESGKDDNTSL